MTPSSPLLPSALTRTVIESLLYGVFLILSTTSLWLLWDQNRIRPGVLPSKPSHARGIPLISATCLLLFGVTGHWIATVVSLFRALVTYKGGTAPEEYYATLLDNPSTIASTALFFFCILVYDVVSVYRVWVIWAFRPRIAMYPTCFLIAFIVSGIGGAYATSRQGSIADGLRSTWWKWDTAALSASLFVNLYCSLFIYARIVIAKVELVRSGLEAGFFQLIPNLLLMLLKSGFIYTMWAIFHFICYEVPDTVSFVTGACSPAVAGITLALVIVQSRLHWPRDPSGVGKADEMQFGVPRKSNVYSIGLETADAVTETRDARELELSELSTEAREVKLDFPVE